MSEIRNQRFSSAISIGKASNNVAVFANSPLIFQYMYNQKKEGTLEERTINGLLSYGNKNNCLNQAKQLADCLLKASKQDQQSFKSQVMKLYTKECFLYRHINMFLRNAEFEGVGQSKIISPVYQQAKDLLPFCQILNQQLKNKYDYTGYVYRGSQLSQEQIQQYKNNINKIRQWNAFTSTSKNKTKAEKFGNTLFRIRLTKARQGDQQGDSGYGLQYSNYGIGGCELAKFSYFPQEQEVLIFAGVQVLIRNVEFIQGKHVITIICTNIGA